MNCESILSHSNENDIKFDVWMFQLQLRSFMFCFKFKYEMNGNNFLSHVWKLLVSRYCRYSKENIMTIRFISAKNLNIQTQTHCIWCELHITFTIWIIDTHRAFSYEFLITGMRCLFDEFSSMTFCHTRKLWYFNVNTIFGRKIMNYFRG